MIVIIIYRTFFLIATGQRGFWEEPRKRIDLLILFKMLVLQQPFNLSDVELECQVNEGRSFEDFAALSVMNNIPDGTTIAFFKERLRKAGLIRELL